MAFNVKNLSSAWFGYNTGDYNWLSKIWLRAPKLTGSNDYVLVFEGINGISIEGALAYGETLTAVVTPNPQAVREYRWSRGSTGISGETGSTYTITAADIGYQLKVRAIVADGVWEDSNYTGVINLTDVTVTGTTSVGNVLTAHPNPLGGDSYTYQWYRDGVAIEGATGYTYVLQSADAGKSVKVRAFTRNVNYYVDSTPLSIIGLTGASINGTAKVGSTLTASYTPSNLTGVSYQWYRGTIPITGATGRTYVLQNADRTYKIKVRVTLGNSVDSAQTSTVVGFVKKTVDITLTDETTYNFGKTIRNPVLVYSVSVACDNGGSDFNLQAGVRCSAIGLNYSNAGWNTTSYSISGTFNASNNAEITSINVDVFAAAWRNSGSGGSLNERVTSYSLKITSYYALE